MLDPTRPSGSYLDQEVITLPAPHLRPDEVEGQAKRVRTRTMLVGGAFLVGPGLATALIGLHEGQLLVTAWYLSITALMALLVWVTSHSESSRATQRRLGTKKLENSDRLNPSLLHLDRAGVTHRQQHIPWAQLTLCDDQTHGTETWPTPGQFTMSNGRGGRIHIETSLSDERLKAIAERLRTFRDPALESAEDPDAVAQLAALRRKAR